MCGHDGNTMHVYVLFVYVCVHVRTHGGQRTTLWILWVPLIPETALLHAFLQCLLKYAYLHWKHKFLVKIIKIK